MNPLLNTLKDLPKRVLLAGAGGGFDVFSGIPIYQWLRDSGHEVVLANLSFSNLRQSDADEVFPNLFRVTPETEGPKNYFPEHYLSSFLSKQLGESVDVYGFRKEGVANLTRSYAWLAEEEEIDAIVVVDGGTDALMRGDEPDLGTPAEDLSTLWAANQTGLQSVVASIGFGIDTFHGVCHYYFLEAVAELTASGGFLGTVHLLPETDGVDLYDDACTFAFGRTNHPSIVSSHILAAINGQYGDVHPTTRTHGHKLWINPLMAMYWGFDLKPVVDRHLFLPAIADTETIHELGQALMMERAKITPRDWMELHA